MTRSGDAESWENEFLDLQSPVRIKHNGGYDVYHDRFLRKWVVRWMDFGYPKIGLVRKRGKRRQLEFFLPGGRVEGRSCLAAVGAGQGSGLVGR